MKAVALLDLVQSRQSGEMTFGLNDTEVTFMGRGAQVDILIEDEIGTADGLFGLAEFRKAVVAWSGFLSAPCSREHLLKVDISY
jgi:hypothetical protein